MDNGKLGILTSLSEWMAQPEMHLHAWVDDHVIEKRIVN